MSRMKRGIFCLEADWWGNPRSHASVRPVLDLLNQPGVSGIPFVYHDVATRAEFEHHVVQWTQRRFARYSVLYLAFHGFEGAINFGDGRKSENIVRFDELGDLLEGRCKNRIIYFGSCETMKVHGQTVNRFLRQTEALGVCGYRHEEVDWLASTALEVLLLDALTSARGTRASLRRVERDIRRDAGGLAKRYDFKLQVLPSPRRNTRNITPARSSKRRSSPSRV